MARNVPEAKSATISQQNAPGAAATGTAGDRGPSAHQTGPGVGGFGGFVLAIGGFDPGAGAGVVRDLLTARALGADAVMVATAWTVQSPAGVTSVEPRAATALEAAISVGLRREPSRGADPGGGAAVSREGGRGMAVKIGMLADEESAAAVLRALEAFGGPVVLDPVLAASSGGALFLGEPAQLLPLVGRADLVTPNAIEAAALTGIVVADPSSAAAAGRALCSLGARAALVKGGHVAGQEAIDVLVTAAGPSASPDEQRFAGPRLGGPPVRGTGCALATAIAVGLARGLPLAAAIAGAKGWVAERMARPVAAAGEWHLS